MNRGLRPSCVLALGFALGACGAAEMQPASAPTSAHVHARPSTHAMTRALERVSPEAIRCLRPGDSVAVTGEFDGANGEYQVTRIAGSANTTVPYAVETCVRVATERAHVRPFTDEDTVFAYTFVAPGTSPAEDTHVVPVAPPTPMAEPVFPRTPPPATQVAGSVEVVSRPSPSELIGREGDALQRCYEQAAERDHTISGSIELHITLDARGTLTRVSSTVQAPPREDITLMDLVARCIEAHVRLIQFGPQSSASTDVVVPLTFHPGGIPID